MIKSLKRIHIIGGPGSGKSYLGKKLSQLLKIPYVTLDRLYWDRSFARWERKTPKSDRQKQLKTVLRKKSWIVEGHYYHWVKESFSKADFIILLTPKLFKRDCNLLKRFIKRKLRITKARKPGKSRKESLRDFIKLIQLNHQYDLGKAELSIKKFKNKTKFFDRADEAIDYLRKLNINTTKPL